MVLPDMATVVCMTASGLSHTSTTGINLQANPRRNSHGAGHKHYSFTDKVTAYAAVLLLAYHRRKAYIYGKELEEGLISEAIENVRML